MYYTGVLEAVRVSRVGFPQRYQHATFLERYHFLASKVVHETKNKGVKEQTGALVSSVLAKMDADDS